MDAILMAGGSGTRLFPLTTVMNKHLLPVANKPMIYYSISTLLLAGAKRIFLVTTPASVDSFKSLLTPITQLGLDITYVIQKKPGGIVEGIKLCEEMITTDKYLLMLGDNFFFGPNLSVKLRQFTENAADCSIICYQVRDPRQLGVVQFENEKIIDIIEKPDKFVGNNAITGLYLFDQSSFEYANEITRSNRGELEITDLIKMYVSDEKIQYTILGRGFTWFDLGTLKDIDEANRFVNTIQNNQGYFIACIEEQLLQMKLTDIDKFRMYIESLPGSEYKTYLEQQK